MGQGTKRDIMIMILGSPDDSLKVHGDEKVHFGHPGMKWLE